MSGVGVTGLLANLPGTVSPYPVLDFSLGLGGMRVVSTNAQRNAIPSNMRQEGMLVYCTTTKLLYQLAPDLSTWNAIANNPITGSQAAWKIDAATGNDDNDGTPAHPLATVDEMNRRLSCCGQRTPLTTAVTITFGPGHYGTLRLLYDLSPGTSLTILGDVTESAPIVLSSVTNESPSVSAPVRGQVVTAAGSFLPHQQMIVKTGAQTGARAFCAELGADAQHVFTSGWFGFFSGVTTPPSIGDSVVFYTRNTTVDIIDVSPGGPGPTAQSTVIQDLILGKLGNVNDTVYRSAFLTNGGSVFWVGIDWAPSSRLQGSACFVYQSRNLGDWYVESFGESGATGVNACSTQNVLYHLPGTKIYYGDVANNLVDGGTWAIGCASFSDRIGKSSGRINVTQFCNGGSAEAAIIVADGSNAAFGVILWGGASASAYPIGLKLTSGAWFGCSTSFSNCNFPATTNAQLSGHNLAFSAAPVCYPRANCGLYLNPDPSAAPVNT